MGSTTSPSSITVDSSALALSTRSCSQLASRPRPTVNTTSASATRATSAPPGMKEWGSLPGRSRAKTSARSPPTTLAQSPTKLVVATTWTGGPEVVAASTTLPEAAGGAEGESAAGGVAVGAWVGWAGWSLADAAEGVTAGCGAAVVSASWLLAQAPRKRAANTTSPTSRGRAKLSKLTLLG